MAVEQATGSTLKKRHISMIALGGAIGGGLLVGSSSAIAQAGSGTVLAYILTGMFVMTVMTMLGKMVIAHPKKGSFVAYIRLAHGPLIGYLAGWLYWFFWMVVIGCEAIASAVLLHDWITLPVWFLAVMTVVILLLINVGAVNIFGETEFWLSLIKVMAIILFIGLCTGYLVWFHGFSHHIDGALKANLALFPKGVFAMISIIPTTLFTMLGSELGTVAAGDSASPEKTIARVTRSVCWRICSFYVSSFLLILLIAPWTEIVPGRSPFITALTHIGVPHTALIMQVIVLVAVLSCLNSSIYVTARVLSELARYGDAPAIFAGTERTTPKMAVLVSCLFGIVVAFSSILSPSGMFSFLLNCSGAVALVVYVMIAIAYYSLLRKGQMGEETNNFKTLVKTVFALCFGSMVYIVMLYRADQRDTALCCILTVLFFLVLYGVRHVLAGWIGGKNTQSQGG